MLHTAQTHRGGTDPVRFEEPGPNTFLFHVVSVAHGVSQAELFAPTRSRAAIALARQVAIYLGHISCGVSLTDAGARMGRDRTTAAHACNRIEDRRDDAVFDTALDYLDAALRTRIRYRSAESSADAASSDVTQW
jgi:hypothetical protein